MKNDIVFCLIVKNEVKNIEKCLLNSCIKEDIKHVLIVDTGSTDGTQTLIKELYKKYNLNGRLVEHSFKDCKCHPLHKEIHSKGFHFGMNRSYALDMCYNYFKKQCNFIFMTDADDEFKSTELNNSPKIGLLDYVNKYKNKRYCIHFSRKTCEYYRPLIFPNNNEYKFYGGLHEFLSKKKPFKEIEEYHILTPFNNDNISIEMVSGKQGNERNENPLKYKNDALFLEYLLELDFEKELKWRYTYYCGQSWFDYANNECPDKETYDKAHLYFDQLISAYFEEKDKKPSDKNLSDKPSGNPWLEEVYCAIKNKCKILIENKAKILLKESDYTSLIETCNKGIKSNPQRIELYYYKFLLNTKLNIFDTSFLKEGLSKASREGKFLFYEKYLFETSQKIIQTYFPKREFNIVLFFSSYESEIKFDIDFSKLNYNTEIISLESSFTGRFDSYILKDNMNLNFNPDLNYYIVCVNCVLDRSKINIDPSKYKLCFYDCVKNTFLSYNEFNVNYKDEKYLLNKLKKLNFDFVVRYNKEIGETFEELKEISLPRNKVINWFDNRTSPLNFNVLENGFELVVKNFYKEKEKINISLKEKNVCFESSINRILNINETNIMKFSSYLELFAKAQILFKEFKNDVIKLKEIFDYVSPFFYKLDINNEDKENLLKCRFIKDIPVKTFIENKRFINDHYQPYIDSIKKELKKKKSNKKEILLTMTTCKRLDMFRDTMNSILLNFPLKELLLIDTFYIVDDGSSEEDRKKMKEEFEWCEFVFNPPLGHSNSMNCIYDKALEYKYVIGLEDDFYFFEKRNYISESIKVLENDQKVSQIVFNRCNQEVDLYDPRRKGCSTYSEDLLGEPPYYFYHTPFLKKINGPEKDLEINLNFTSEGRNTFLDGTDKASHITFWKGFTFMPSMYSVEKTFKKVGRFVTKGFFEGTFSEEVYWSGSKTAYFDTFSVYHCGKLAGEINTNIKNAYELNEKDQYGKNKEEKFIKVLASLEDIGTEKLKKIKDKYVKELFKIEFVDDFGSIVLDESYDTIEKCIKKNIEDSAFTESESNKTISLYTSFNTILGNNSPFKFYFKKDIFGYDIARFRGLSIKELEQKTIELGGNAFNSLGFIKKIEKPFTLNYLPLLRNKFEGIYIIV